MTGEQIINEVTESGCEAAVAPRFRRASNGRRPFLHPPMRSTSSVTQTKVIPERSPIA